MEIVIYNVSMFSFIRLINILIEKKKIPISLIFNSQFMYKTSYKYNSSTKIFKLIMEYKIFLTYLLSNEL